jgi:hypothetical protein
MMNIQQLPRLVNRASLLAVPVLFGASGLAIPALRSGDGAELALISAHSTGWYVFTMLSLVGSLALIPASIALMQMTSDAAPFPSIVGSGLIAIGGFVALADSATQLVYWQMGARSANRAQMVALLHRYENAPGAAVIFMIGALALVAGTVLMAVALIRAHAMPAWAATLIPVGMVLNIGAFLGSSRMLLIASSIVLLVGMGRSAFEPRPERAGVVASVQ